MSSASSSRQSNQQVMEPSYDNNLPSQNNNQCQRYDLNESQLQNPSVLPINSNLNDDKAYDDLSHVSRDVLDTLPKVWTRGLLYFLFTLAAVGLPWSIFFRIDEVGSARGRLEPKGGVLKVDAASSGNVTEVLVEEGQIVKARQPLLRLESELVRNDLQQAEIRLESQLNRLAQLETFKRQLFLSLQTQKDQNQAQELAKLSQTDQARQTLSANRDNYQSGQAEQIALVEQAQQEVKAKKAALGSAKIRLTRDEGEVRRYRKLWQEEVIAEVQAIEKEKLAQESRQLQAQAEAEVELAKLRLVAQQNRYESTINRANSEIEQAELRSREQQSSYKSLVYSGEMAALKVGEQVKELRTQITALNGEISQTKSQIQALNFQLEQRIIRTPVSGRVFKLATQRTGTVVQSGSLVAEIAPEGSPFTLRAEMNTQESGFLQKDMPVKIKFDAYPFQDYGVVKGEVIKISPNSKVTQTAQGQATTFDLEVKLDQTCIQTKNDCIQLLPGQTATAEVVIRQRRVIDFILDPFKKL